MTILRLALRLLYRVRLEGHPPPAGDTPPVYVAAHRSRLDSVLLPLFLPGAPVVVVPREDLASLPLRLALCAVPHLLAETNDPALVKKTLRLLAAGRPVLFYPEGRLLQATGVMKHYGVPAVVAAKSGAPVVPVVVRAGPGLRPMRIAHLGHAGRVDPVPERYSGRARRALAVQRMQRLLEAAVVDARERESLFDAFLAALRREGRRTRIVEDMKEQPRSYQELLRGALAIGRWMTRFTEPRENVGLLLPNVIPTVCAILGAMAFRRVPAMLNYTAGPVAARSACTAAQVRTVITSRAFVEQARLGPLVSALHGVRLVYLEDVRAELTLRDKLWLMAYAQWLPRHATPRRDAYDPAVVLFTSGSEAHPKGVVLSHDAVIANVRQIGTVMDFTARDTILNALPVYHSYSFTAGLMLCLISGTRLFLYISPLRYRAIPEIAYRRDVTGLYGTGTFLSYWARYANPLDFRTVRYVISGGEKLGEEVARLYLEKFGLRIFEGYGATECAPVIALSTPQCYRLGTVGRPLPGVATRLEKLDGIAHGGVLHVRGPNLMLGYYRFDRPGVIEPPASIFGPGWHSTGDVVDVGEDGVISVVGRMKRFAKIAGEMISLDTIEEIALRTSPAHRHAAVLRAQAAGGETTVLFTTDARLTRQHLMQTAREMGRPDLAVARHIFCMPGLPLLASGKTDYVTLQALDLSEAAANEPALLSERRDREA
jgi:acyl-[acyl-carrier-protein]-phospholipid O-acyltransferase/long-chain-fatty-acid--[acyl-carrier-protein] ligase